MNNEELIEFLKDNLTISIHQHTKFGPTDVIEVSLFLMDDEISTSETDLDLISVGR